MPYRNFFKLDIVILLFQRSFGLGQVEVYTHTHTYTHIVYIWMASNFSFNTVNIRHVELDDFFNLFKETFFIKM